MIEEKEVEEKEVEEKTYLEILEENNKQIKNNYIDNEVFKSQLRRYQDDREFCQLNGLPEPRIPEEIGLAIMKICNNNF
jgi:hypothetical protein